MCNHTSETTLRQCSAREQCINPQGSWLPATLEHFGPRKDRPSGLQSRCRVCERARICEDKRAKRREDPSYASNQRLKYLAAARENSLRWYHANKERSLERSAAWRRAHPGYNAAWYFAHKHMQPIYWKAYVRKNPERARARSARRRAIKANAPGTHTDDDIRLLYKSQKGLCWWCGKRVGDSYHVDHRVPLSRGGSDSADNLVISCGYCNDSRGNKLPHEWHKKGRLL